MVPDPAAHGHSCLELFHPTGSRLCSLCCWTPWPRGGGHTKRPRISTLLWEFPPRQPLAALCCPQLGRSHPARTPPAPSICTHHLGIWSLVSWGPLHPAPSQPPGLRAEAWALCVSNVISDPQEEVWGREDQRLWERGRGGEPRLPAIGAFCNLV